MKLLPLLSYGLFLGLTQVATPENPTKSMPISIANAAYIEQQTILQGNTPWMLDIEFSPQGDRLAVAETASAYEGFEGVQGKVRIWNTTTWEEETLLSSDDLSAMSIAFDEDGNYLAVGNTTGEIQFWYINLQRVDTTLISHDTWVNALAFGSGDALLVSGSGAIYNTNSIGDSTIRLWLVSPLEETREIMILTPPDASLGAGLAVSFSPDGSLVAAGMTNGTVHLWGVESKKEYAILDEFAWADDLLFTPDSAQILFAANDGVRVWNVQAAVETFGYIPEYLLIAPLQEKEFIFSLALNPDGTVLAVGYQDGSIRLWNMDTGEQLTRLEGHADRVVSLAFSPDGTLLASGGVDGTVRLWGVREG